MQIEVVGGKLDGLHGVERDSEGEEGGRVVWDLGRVVGGLQCDVV